MPYTQLIWWQDHVRERRAHSNEAIFKECLIKGLFPKEWVRSREDAGATQHLQPITRGRLYHSKPEGVEKQQLSEAKEQSLVEGDTSWRSQALGEGSTRPWRPLKEAKGKKWHLSRVPPFCSCWTPNGQTKAEAKGQGHYNITNPLAPRAQRRQGNTDNGSGGIKRKHPVQPCSWYKCFIFINSNWLISKEHWSKRAP